MTAQVWRNFEKNTKIYNTNLINCAFTSWKAFDDVIKKVNQQILSIKYSYTIYE